jgi:hypothetical protein
LRSGHRPCRDDQLAKPETQANDISGYPAISGDGHYVVFLSAATNRHDMVFLVLIAMLDGISFRFPML